MKHQHLIEIKAFWLGVEELNEFDRNLESRVCLRFKRETSEVIIVEKGFAGEGHWIFEVIEKMLSFILFLYIKLLAKFIKHGI